MGFQFCRPGEQRGEHVELVWAGGAGQHADAPEAAVAEVAPLGQTSLGPIHGIGLPLPMAAQDLRFGAQPGVLRREQVGGFRDDQPAERPPH